MARTQELSMLPVFHLRDLPMAPERGMQRDVCWWQFSETVQLRLLLSGDIWEGVQEGEFQVCTRESALSVKCQGAARSQDVALQSVNGELNTQINPLECRFWLTPDFEDPLSTNRTLVIELAKKHPGKPWREQLLFQEERPDAIFQHKAFHWTPQQQENAVQEAEWVPAKHGRRLDLDDKFTVSRSWLCSELEQGQTDDLLFFRIVLDQKKLDEALERTPYYRLFGLDCSERFLKLFIRGDECEPVLLGELGGKVVPDQSTFELTELTREVYGHRIAGTTETLPCLDVSLVKAGDSRGQWQELLQSDEGALNQPQGSLEEFQESWERSKREPSPDREDWTPDDWADEQKEKADAAFKEGVYRDAAVYYTRALRYTPRNEKLLSNRSAAYLKMGKSQLALDDALEAEKIEPNWTKIYFRKGQALRGLKRFDDAVAAFREGKELDAKNPDWDREIQNTLAVERAVQQKKAKGAAALQPQHR